MSAARRADAICHWRSKTVQAFYVFLDACTPNSVNKIVLLHGPNRYR